MGDSKIIKFTSWVLTILFIILFILLFSYIYQDYESLKPTSEFIDISQNQKEIKLDTNNKEKTQPVIDI